MVFAANQVDSGHTGSYGLALLRSRGIGRTSLVPRAHAASSVASGNEAKEEQTITKAFIRACSALFGKAKGCHGISSGNYPTKQPR